MQTLRVERDELTVQKNVSEKLGELAAVPQTEGNR